MVWTHSGTPCRTQAQIPGFSAAGSAFNHTRLIARSQELLWSAPRAASGPALQTTTYLAQHFLLQTALLTPAVPLKAGGLSSQSPIIHHFILALRNKNEISITYCCKSVIWRFRLSGSKRSLRLYQSFLTLILPPKGTYTECEATHLLSIQVDFAAANELCSGLQCYKLLPFIPK